MVEVPAGHSILDYKAKDFPAAGNRTTVGGLRAMTLEHALVRVSESFYKSSGVTPGGAAALKDGSVLVRQLLDGNHSVIAGRLAGALSVQQRDRR